MNTYFSIQSRRQIYWHTQNAIEFLVNFHIFILQYCDRNMCLFSIALNIVYCSSIYMIWIVVALNLLATFFFYRFVYGFFSLIVLLFIGLLNYWYSSFSLLTENLSLLPLRTRKSDSYRHHDNYRESNQERKKDRYQKLKQRISYFDCTNIMLYTVSVQVLFIQYIYLIDVIQNKKNNSLDFILNSFLKFSYYCTNLSLFYIKNIQFYSKKFKIIRLN